MSVRIVVASIRGLVALTVVALPSALSAEEGRSFGPSRLTTTQMDQIRAAGIETLSCTGQAVCLQNNQQNVTGPNIGGSVTVNHGNGGVATEIPIGEPCPSVGVCVQNNQQNTSGTNFGVGAIILFD
jgi:hypothetical protein